MWLGQKEAVGASSSCVTPQSPEKKEMAACMSKRRDKEGGRMDVFIVLALGGMKRGEARRTPVKPFWNKRTCAMQIS